MSILSVRIENNLEQPLEAVTKAIHRSKNWVINEALREYLSHRELENKRWEDTLEALEDIRMGKVVDGDKVHAWLESWGTNNKLEAPNAE